VGYFLETFPRGEGNFCMGEGGHSKREVELSFSSTEGAVEGSAFLIRLRGEMLPGEDWGGGDLQLP